MSLDSKEIWTYWHQGFDQAPRLVKKCTEEWIRIHPSWKIHLLDSSSVREFIDPLPIKSEVLDKMKLAHQSDLVRTQLLIRYGGVWADPTIWPLVPLDDWLLLQTNSRDHVRTFAPARSNPPVQQ